MIGNNDEVELSKQAVVLLCCIEDEKNFAGYSVEQDGLYVIPLDANTSRNLSPQERAAAVAYHPNGRHDTPALSLPCKLGTLRQFFVEAGLSGCIDEESVDEVAAEYGLKTDGSESDTATVCDGDGDDEPKRGAMITTHRLQTRRNILDPAIDKAISNAGSLDTAAVYLALRLLALGEESPFSGAIDGDALCYTNSKGNPDKLTKDALSKRLKGRADKRH